MQTLVIVGEIGYIHYGHDDNGEEIAQFQYQPENNGPDKVFTLNTDEHEWRIETYGIWWKSKKFPSREHLIPFNKIRTIDMEDRS
jgi:hypothetical protein